MASIHVKPDGAFIVRWRVDGKPRGRQFKNRADAESFKRTLEAPPLNPYTFPRRRARTLAFDPAINRSGG